jgi:glycosyltransferase involved in cell wall biosynthesis
MGSRIRVCYVLNAFAVGGAETVALDLARSLDPERFDVTVLAVQEPRQPEEPEMRRRFREAGVRTEVLHLRSLRNPLALLALWRCLRRGCYDVVHGHNRPSDGWAVRVAGWAGVPARLWTRHLVYRDLTPVQRRRYQAMSRRAGVVLAVSDAVRRACIEVEGLAPQRVRTLVNGIDLERYRPLTPAAVAAKRAELGLREGDLACLFVGRLSAQKAPDAFVRLVWSLRRRGVPARGFVCGGGGLAGSLREMIDAGEAGVELLGFRSDVPDLLSACDLFVSTSRNEGLPLNVMEAMAAGAAVVAPSLDQISCLFPPQDVAASGLYAAPPEAGDAPDALIETWANRVAALLADPVRRREMGLHGRSIIRDSYSLASMVAAHEAVYRELLGAPRG